MALNVLMDLEMVEFVDNKIYKVKNFVKHQNIKIKENVEISSIVESKEVKVEVKNKEEKTEKNLENQRCEEKHVNSQDKESKDIEKISGNKVIMDKTMNFESPRIEKVQNNFENTINSHNKVKDNYLEDIQLCSIPIPSKEKKTRKANKNSNKKLDYLGDINETNEEECIIEFFDGEDPMPQREGDKIIRSFSMIN